MRSKRMVRLMRRHDSVLGDIAPSTDYQPVRGLDVRHKVRALGLDISLHVRVALVCDDSTTDRESDGKDEHRAVR